MTVSSKRALRFAISILLISACAPHRTIVVPPPGTLLDLKDQLNLLVQDPNLVDAQLGIIIENLDNGSTLFRVNQHKRFIPASNMKLYTTAAALSRLGESFRYRTEFYMQGAIKDSVLEGNLIIHGKGDPSISGRFKENDVSACFRDWADSLKHMGIGSIRGNIIGDDTYFKGDKLGTGWNWDDETYWYSAQISALSYNDNCVDLLITSGESSGDPVTITLTPQSAPLQLLNSAITVHADSGSSLSINRQRAQNIIEIRGSLPQGTKPFTESITVEDPPRYFLHNMKAIFRESGIRVDGDIELSEKSCAYDSLIPLFTHRSPTLPELMEVVNKGSHNFYADQLFKTIGAEEKGAGTWRNGADAVKEWLGSIGVAVNHISVFDGSGLSRLNLVTPSATAAVLRFMYRHKSFTSFYNSLPVAGVDGTLKRRMTGTAAEGNVRAKTGYVMHVRSLSGYVHDRDNTPYLFVIMVNHYSVPTSYINALQDRICILLSNYQKHADRR